MEFLHHLCINCNSGSGVNNEIVVVYDGPAGAVMALFNPFRVEIVCESAYPGFAPRAGLSHPSGVPSRMWSRRLMMTMPCRNPSGSSDPEGVA